MKRLILMRHAKSSWNAQGLRDHDRPLNGRGVRSANALGVWLAQQEFVIDEALISSSKRTQETFEGLGLSCEVRVRKELYHASAAEMLAQLTKSNANTLLLVGHNPGIALLAHELVARGPSHSRFDDYPTGATLVAQFTVDTWVILSPQSGCVEAFLTPHDLLPYPADGA